MTFNEALVILNIEDYSTKIFESNSHGELFHLYGYIQLVEMRATDIRPMFLELVEEASTWNRPKSIYQHIPEQIEKLLRAK